MLSDQVFRRVADPVLAARLQLLHARAEGCGVTFQQAGTLEVARREISDDLAVITGNLVENAIDAVADRGRDGWVQLSLARDADGALLITVRDNGPGIPHPAGQIFTPGWSTKGNGRGFGLALLCDKVHHLHAAITAHNDGGAVFEVRIPAPHHQEPQDQEPQDQEEE